MQIEKITVRAGRVVPHPLYAYGNLKADLEIVANLDAGDDPAEVQRRLQSQVESDVENHVANLKGSIRDYEQFSQQANRIKRLETELAAKQSELETLKADFNFDECPLFAPQAKRANTQPQTPNTEETNDHDHESR